MFEARHLSLFCCHSLQLYEIGKSAGKNIQMHSFSAVHGFGHKHIHKAPELIAVFRFVGVKTRQRKHTLFS